MTETRAPGIPGQRKDRIPSDLRGAHPARPTPTVEQPEAFPLGSIWNQDFPPETTISTDSIIPITSTTDRLTKPRPDKELREYELPAGVIIYDEEGNEIDRLSQPTVVRGTWTRSNKRQGGPAPRFEFESRFPLGNENALRRTRGIVKRFGKLWFGQTTEDLKNK